MKLLFICGSLEPGKDGVGDYTRRLAAELIRQGNQVTAIALYDRSIRGIHKEKQKQEEVNIQVLRLGSNKSSRIRFINAREWLDKYNPEWLSLQFVPFSFQDKGLPWTLGKKLSKLGAGKNWHIMFHELWIGMDKKASFKNRVIGKLQKQIIKRTINVLAPISVHTHTRLYQLYLDKIGCKTELLSLFGNIPNFFQPEAHNENEINIAVFGGIHRGAKLKKLINELPKTNRYKFHFIGSNGPWKEDWVEILNQENLNYELYGWMGMRDVSKVLSKCQWGLTSTPYYLSEKSGSAAAMLEHNLTVFCIARKWKPRNIKPKFLINDSIIKWKKNLDLERFIEKNECNSKYNIKVIGKKFIDELKTNRA